MTTTHPVSIHAPLPLEHRSPWGFASGRLSIDGPYGIWTCLAWAGVIRALVFLAGAISVWTAQAHHFGEYASGRPWIAYDSIYYLQIVQEGYRVDGINIRLLAFFPGFPLAARALSAVFPPMIAMLIVSNTCAMFGFGFFYLWAKDLLGARTAFISTLLLASFPAAVFYSAGLTEAPFMMLTGLALLLCRRNHWYGAATVCAVATFTRPTAGALGMMLVIAFLIRRDPMPWRTRVLHGMLLGTICLSGGFAYEAYIFHRTGDAFAYEKVQNMWQVDDDARRANAAALAAAQPAVEPPRHTLPFYVKKAVTPQAWNRVLAIALLTITIGCLVRRTVVPRVWFIMPLAIFMLGYLPNHGMRASSVLRYEMASLPIFLAIGWWFAAKPSRHLGLICFLTVSLMMQVYYAVCFGRGIWVG